MDFYITPDKQQECIKKIDRMFKHFTVKPTVEYSNVEKVVKRTTISYVGGSSDENGCTTYKEILDAIKVTISDIEINEWRLVASVYHQENIVTLVDSELFKSIPSQYGVSYTKCDYCGKSHVKRNESHILYNTVTKTWMQVGSACVEKMIPGGKYLNSIMLQLYKFFTISLAGSDEFGWEGGSWRPAPDHYYSKALNIDEAVCICREFRKDNPVWIKAEYDHGYKTKEGTGDYLRTYMDNNKVSVDTEYFNKVKAYVSTLTGGLDRDGAPDMNQKIIDVFNSEYVRAGEIYLAYFAQKGYEDSLTAQDYMKYIEQFNIQKGEKRCFHVKLIDVERVEEEVFYGYRPSVQISFLHKFQDVDTGLILTKSLARRDLIDEYKCDDDTYMFNATVKYISYKRQKVVLGGRLSKCKK